MKEIKSHLLVLLASFFIAGSFLASAKLSGIINPISLTLLRFIIASMALLPVVLLKKKYRQKIISTLPRSLVISLFYSVYFILLFEALNTTTAINTGTLYTLVPLTTAFFALLVFKEKIDSRRLLVYLTGAIGTIWVVFNGKIDLLLSFSLNRGDLIFILSVVSISCYSIAMKLLYRNDDMVVLVFCTLIGGAMWMSVAIVALSVPLQWSLLQEPSWGYMAYLAIIATLGSAYLQQKTTVVLGPNRVMAYIYLNPAFVVLLQFFLQGESISIILIPGILLSAIATFILQTKVPSNHKSE